MEQLRLKSCTNTYFNSAWKLYEEAFPFEERRILEAQKQVMKTSNYHFDIVIHKKQFIGFLLWWDLETFRYIDHFATDSQQRNKGIGKLILETFRDSTDKPILLEVELPHSTINQRRIKFYERIGFKLNHHHYEVPPSTVGESPLQFLLMSYPALVSKHDVEHFINKCHPIIFKD